MFLFPYKKKINSRKIDLLIGKDINTDLDFLLKTCKELLPKFDQQLIKKAFLWTIEAHKDKKRKSGDPSYTHPLAIAHIVINEMPLDDISVACALLHDVVNESNIYTINDIASEFGATIAEIVDSILKIHNIESREIVHLENYRKLLLSLFKDVRIILIKLADRLHSMRTLEFLNPEEQIKIASETLEI